VQTVAQAGSRRSERDAAAVPVQQLRAEAFFQLAKLQRYRRLAQLQIACRAAEIAGLRGYCGAFPRWPPLPNVQRQPSGQLLHILHPLGSATFRLLPEILSCQCPVSKV
jgi:hypothetical protein